MCNCIARRALALVLAERTLTGDGEYDGSAKAADNDHSLACDDT